jgi:hypothetical protein
MTKQFVRKGEINGKDLSLNTTRELISDWPEFAKSPRYDSRLVLEVEEDDGVGNWYWHVHHEILAEPLIEPLENRIDYIKSSKNSKKVRLKWLTSVKGPLPQGLEQLWKKTFEGKNPTDVKAVLLCPDLEKLHKKEHPGCPWNGQTILGDKI